MLWVIMFIIKSAQMGLQELLLTNDISVFPDWDQWIFRMRALSTHILKGGLRIYYSTKTPLLEI